MTGTEIPELYDKMAEVLESNSLEKKEQLRVDTRFCGTRENPELTGGISNLTLENFGPEYLIRGVLEGMADELLDIYEKIRKTDIETPVFLIGSGNGIRKNIHLRKMFEERLGMRMQIPMHKEEAAYGAALYALASAGICAGLSEAQEKIGYLTDISEM